MDDKELLEFAAKAAGYKGKWDSFWWGMCCGENYWDPLRNRLQAFRLLAEVGKEIKPDRLTAIISKDIPTFCRAIVTTAAEIGKAKP